MKLEPYASWNRSKGRKPLRSALEIAKSLGLTMPQLRGYLAKDGAPKPEIRHRASGAFYEPVAFMRWWKVINV